MEYFRFIALYDQLVEHLFNTSNTYFIGARGNRNSSFRICITDKSRPIEPIYFGYNGREELDYSIWTKDSVLAFESKQFRTSSLLGLGFGWQACISMSSFLRVQRAEYYPNLLYAPKEFCLSLCLPKNGFLQRWNIT